MMRPSNDIGENDSQQISEDILPTKFSQSGSFGSPPGLLKRNSGLGLRSSAPEPEIKPRSSTTGPYISLRTGMGSWIPTHVDYWEYHRRLESFHKWPLQMKQRPDALAACGFYYSGGGDKVVCFGCGLGLHQWNPEDNPYDEHKYHTSNTCKFLKTLKP